MNLENQSSKKPPLTARRSFVNTANSVTIIRLMLAPVLGWSITHGHWWLATFTMVGAITSDVLDGKLARNQGTASTFGGLFDHATDAIFVSTGAWALAAVGLINPWLWPVIGIAFLQYTLDSNSLRGHQLRTSKLGKYNGIGYYALVSTAIGYQTLLSTSLLGPAALPILQELGGASHNALRAVAWLLLASTLISMVDRLRHVIVHRLDVH